MARIRHSERKFDDLRKFVLDRPATTQIGDRLFAKRIRARSYRNSTADHALAAKSDSGYRLPRLAPRPAHTLALIDLISEMAGQRPSA